MANAPLPLPLLLLPSARLPMLPTLPRLSRSRLTSVGSATAAEPSRRLGGSGGAAPVLGTREAQTAEEARRGTERTRGKEADTWGSVPLLPWPGTDLSKATLPSVLCRRSAEAERPASSRMMWDSDSRRACWSMVMARWDTVWLRWVSVYIEKAAKRKSKGKL